MKFRHSPLVLFGFVLLGASVSGCYQIANPDRKVVAVINGEEIRRGELRKIIGDMSDEERPLIQTRQDLLDFLNNHLNQLIKIEEARELRIDGKITVDRAQARAIYLARHPEYATIENATDPTNIGISRQELTALQAEMAFGIDDVEELLYQEAAFNYLLQQYIEEEQPQISDAEFEEAYTRLEDSLKTFEAAEFYGLRFRVGPGAQQEAVKARKRIDDGEEFDAVLESYLNISPQYGISAALEKNTVTGRFFSFWYSATGSEPGDIIGPVYLEAYDQIVNDQNGQPVSQRQPDAWVLVKIDKMYPVRQKTLDEAKSDLAGPIIRDRVMNRLREQYGVEVFPEELPRPEGYGDQFKNQMIKTRSGA